MPGPFPGPHVPNGLARGLEALLGVAGGFLAAMVGIIALVAVAAFLVVLVRFLVVGTKAAELYVAEHRSTAGPDGPVAADPAPAAPPAADAPPASEPARTRTPRTPRTRVE